MINLNKIARYLRDTKDANFVKGGNSAELVYQKLQNRLDSPELRPIFDAFFIMVLIFAIFKDVFDVLLTITVVLIPMTIILAFVAGFIITFFFLYKNISLTIRRLVGMAITAIIEVIPIGNVIPTLTISFLIICVFENRRRKKKREAIENMDADMIDEVMTASA